MEILPKDREILDQFRHEAVDMLPESEKITLWKRIERTLTKRFFIRSVIKWTAAAACVALLSIAGYRLFGNGNGNENTENTVSDVQMLAIETQNEQMQKIMLPDSSIVWLNGGSRIEYPENFTEQREISLTGEAYFQVTHRESKPFKVHTAKLDVIVLGTIFNVMAYDDNTDIVVTLVEGKVALPFEGDHLQQTIMKSNQQAVFNKEPGSATDSACGDESEHDRHSGRQYRNANGGDQRFKI
jgi:ferric-dicitrate binding protein FerR (iron transport regulator)